MWDQNNPGGSFIMNDKLCHRVVIEEDNYNKAENKALKMGIYYNGVEDNFDCECCGDRWYRGEELKFPMQWDEQLAFYNVEDYLDHINNLYGWGPVDSRIFYKDGYVKTNFHK